jgi:hypothetical protein
LLQGKKRSCFQAQKSSKVRVDLVVKEDLMAIHKADELDKYALKKVDYQERIPAAKQVVSGKSKGSVQSLCFSCLRTGLFSALSAG